MLLILILADIVMDIKIEELTTEHGKTNDTPEWVRNNTKKIKNENY